MKKIIKRYLYLFIKLFYTFTVSQTKNRISVPLPILSLPIILFRIIMNMHLNKHPHTFHIPVMGLAYTIDTPIKVARFGISSVISIVEDNLVEKMRSYYYQKVGELYNPISNKVPDYRAKRITDYLNLVNRLVKQQIKIMRSSAFDSGSEIEQYFEMLPDNSELKLAFNQKNTYEQPEKRQQAEEWLRQQIQPGSIDVNIMTKLDKQSINAQGNIIEDGSDAVTALRGYANSNLTGSSLILSSGMNPRLFNYMEKTRSFEANSAGQFDKKIVIKVSDYRSALIQGKMLAKKGLWVSEFRIESGLNCGGHAFATDGYLIGPILEEFKTKRQELQTILFDLYSEALKIKGRTNFEKPHHLSITYQGGIGTHAEDDLLHQYFGMESTGWATPFLLVPEATTVDGSTFQLLANAREQDVTLSNNSPLDVRFYYLKGSSAELEKIKRIEKGTPGSPCPEKLLASNTEFTNEPICTASRTYQKKKIAQLQTLHLQQNDYDQQLKKITDKECLCVGLSNAAVKNYNLPPFVKPTLVNICPGPNIAYFTQEVSLKKMVDHIYGRLSILSGNNRPHFFIKELNLYIDYWNELLTEGKILIDRKKNIYIQHFYENLKDGIFYYRNLQSKINLDFAALSGSKINYGLDEAISILDRKFKDYFAIKI